jgi:lipoate synthase
MIMGEIVHPRLRVLQRGDGSSRQPLDREEPENVAKAVRQDGAWSMSLSPRSTATISPTAARSISPT